MELCWDHVKQIGLIIQSGDTRREFFDEYSEKETTPLGAAITAFRVGSVGAGNVLDIGIGSGAFVKAMGDRCFGYDVDSKAIEWLCEHDKFLDPYTQDLSHIDIVTFWDSFEHIANQKELLDKIQGKRIVMSLPIFFDMEHVLRSKHYKPFEHLWYFTTPGLVDYMDSCGWKMTKHSMIESEMFGREDIDTFVFEAKS